MVMGRTKRWTKNDDGHVTRVMKEGALGVMVVGCDGGEREW